MEKPGSLLRFAGLARRPENAAWIYLLAPVIFGLHVAEEAPGYVRWFNGIAGPPIPESGFLQAQTTPLMAAAFLGAGAAWLRNRWGALVLLLWSSHFFLANALYHLVASVALVTYSPGLVTGTLLYVPYFTWLAGESRRRGVAAWAILFVTFFAGLPALIQTWMVVFEGRRFY
jgi:hypothetical protein